jgi:hypothetical protein
MFGKTLKFAAPLAALALVLGVNRLSKAADEAPAAGKATVNVTVVDKDGKGVEGARVRLMAVEKKTEAAAAEPKAAEDGNGGGSTAKKPKPKPVAEGQTDKDGKVALANVPDGDYVANANVKGGGTGKEAVKVEGGKDVSISITLKEKKPKSEPAAPAAEPK